MSMIYLIRVLIGFHLALYSIGVEDKEIL